MRLIRSLTFALLIIVTASLVGCVDNHLSQLEAKRGLHFLFQAQLPEEADNFHAYQISIFTTMVLARFDCPEKEFERFINDCKLLSTSEKGFTKGATQKHNAPPLISAWWKPEDVKKPQTLSASWTQHNENITCWIQRGKQEGRDDLTVYCRFVLETKEKRKRNSAAEKSHPPVNAN